MSSVLGFDGHAPRYASHWSADPVARRMRNEVHQTLKDLVPSGSHVLDVGCGAGCDTAWLLSKGYRVTAIDQSTGMVEATKASAAEATILQGRAEDLPAAQIQTPVDAVLLNFGVVNAISPIAFMKSLLPLIHRQTVLLVVSMPRFHAAWTLRQLCRGRLRAAWQRCQPEVDIEVHGELVRTRYWNRAELQTCWPDWKCVTVRGLGMVFPPQSSFGNLELGVLERLLGRIPLVNEWGDHALTVWRQI